MEMFLAIAVGLNVVLAVALIVLVVMLRPKGANRDPEALAAAVQAANADLRRELQGQRLELRDDVSRGLQQLDQRLTNAGEAQSRELGRDRLERQQAQQDLTTQLATELNRVAEQLQDQTRRSADNSAKFRTTIDARFDALTRGTDGKLEAIRLTVDEKLQGTLATALEANAQKIQQLTDSNVAKHTELQAVLRQELEKLRTGNEAKLEKMRETVDEKLQGTLEKRLGESFALVSERLEQVQKGLGEMQTLASDVGGLKRVLTNVKNRGSWGEVQLSRQLEDILAPSQYEENVVIKPATQESVEFAVKLPGRDDDAPVYLPIDSKFPQEDYERLLAEQESGDKAEIENMSKSLERAIMTQAKTIASKYIDPPHSTDFAIMYLPTEGLFAEVIRRPGLASRLQSELRVLVTGPTTLMSLLNSLQMGFRTLAIEKRSSEVWKVLSAAKTEFGKYAQVWEKLGKQLETAQRTVHDAGVRTRAVERKLRDVEETDITEAEAAIEEVFSSAIEEAADDNPFAAIEPR